MKKRFIPFTILFVSLFAGTYSFGQFVNLPNGATIPGLIDGNDTILISNGRTAILNGKVYVQAGGRLIIEANTSIRGVKKPTPAEASALVVCRGGFLDCQGSNTQPVVFTSNETTQRSGDWGGIVILGSAPLNRADTSIEGIDLPSLPPGVDVFYGGGAANTGNADQNSGVMRYVRIEFAGANVSAANELNALTFGGVGRGTEIDFVQAIYGTDDGFEWFGGTVNAKHLVSFGNDDDNWDFDFGYSGSLQFVVSCLTKTKPTYSSDPSGIESDNNPTGAVATPQTNVKISNMTVIGVEDSLSASEFLPAPNSKRLLYGARIRRASGVTLHNSIFMGYPTGVRVQDANSSGQFVANLVHGFRVTDQGVSLDGSNQEFVGSVFNANLPIQLNDPFNGTLPDWRPAGSSPALSPGVSFTGLVSTPASFFQTAGINYRGAFSSTQNWAATWTRFFAFPL